MRIRDLMGWGAFLCMLVFSGVVCWDYVHTKLENHERRLTELEATARPLVIVDRFSHVYLNGEEAYSYENEEGRVKKEE